MAACGSGTSNGKSVATTTRGTNAKPVDVPGVGPGVTDDTIKLGVSLIDFDCIPKAFVDSIYVDQPAAYDVYIDNINENGGINGRKLDARVQVHLSAAARRARCPHAPRSPTTARCSRSSGRCTTRPGDAQLCVTKQHETVLITDGLSQEMIDQAPPGLLLTPGITADRRLQVIMSLLKTQHILDGKKVAVLTETTATARVDDVVKPALDDIGVQQGSDAVLSISGSDTTSAQTQLDSFIEKWKSEHVDALILVGPAVSSKQFVNKVKGAIPDLQLVADTTGSGVGRPRTT